MVFLWAVVMYAQPTFRVEVPSVVAVDETFQVVFTANDRVESFEQPKFEDFDVFDAVRAHLTELLGVSAPEQIALGFNATWGRNLA